jgi:RimJ/RimL family protein N-acetyltransferase
MRNPIVIGERLYLRPFDLEDADASARGSHQETETFMNRGRLLVSPVIGFAQTAGTDPAGSVPASVTFAVCRKSDDRYLGMVDLDGIDLINGVAETGSWFHNPEDRGQGYGTEAKHLLLEYAFDRLHLERIVSRVFEPNTRSVAALEKQGYKAAGRIRYHEWCKGRFQDMLLFDLTREEWALARGVS